MIGGEGIRTTCRTRPSLYHIGPMNERSLPQLPLSKMDRVIFDRQASNTQSCFVIYFLRSGSCASANLRFTSRKRFLHDDKPNTILLPLHLGQHNVLAILSVVPIALPEFPACTVFGLKVEEVHACCYDATRLRRFAGEVCIVEKFYPQVTINASRLTVDGGGLSLLETR